MINEDLVAEVQAGKNVNDNLELLYTANKGFIYQQVKPYRGYCEIDDLMQESYLVLYEAVMTFSPERGYKFITYLGAVLRSKIYRFVVSSNDFCIPEYMVGLVIKYERTVMDYMERFAQKPPKSYIKRVLGVDDEKLKDVLKARKQLNTRRLYEAISSQDGDEIELVDMIPYSKDDYEEVIDRVQQEQLKAVVWECVDSLPERQAKVLHMHYENGLPYSQIAEHFGVSDTCIAQLKSTGVRKLARGHYRSRLEPFLEKQRNDIAYNIGLHGGLHSYLSDWTSSTEKACFRLMGVNLKEDEG